MSERKATHLKRLQNRYKEAIERVEQSEGERLRKYKAKIVSDGCFHPETYDWVENCDNGYGRWWKVKVTRCRLCESVVKTDYNHKD